MWVGVGGDAATPAHGAATTMRDLASHLSDAQRTELIGTIVDGQNFLMNKDGRIEKRLGCTAVAMLDANGATVAGARELVVVGAGFIGLEAAATARRTYGCEVTVLEGLPAPLIRALGEAMGSAIAAVHTDQGVDVRCGVQVAGIEGDGTRVTGVRLGSGDLVPADVVLVGIGKERDGAGLRRHTHHQFHRLLGGIGGRHDAVAGAPE